MILERRGLCKTNMTKLTPLGLGLFSFNSTVGGGMLEQRGGVIESFVAHRTHVRLFVRVDELVRLQVSRLRKPAPAVLTQVWFLASVREHVPTQTTRQRKAFGADVARVRFLLRVSKHVSFQIPSLCERFRA